MKPSAIILLLIITSVLLSCDNGSGSNDVNRKDKVIATVDGENIYESELESLLINTFGEDKVRQIDDASKKRALDSLIASNLLVKRAVSTLPKSSLDAIDAKTAHYRDNLLISEYMHERVDKTGISEDEIKNYYDSNLDKFGKTTVKQYQLLSTSERLPEELRDKFISLVSDSRSTGDISVIKKTLEKNGFVIRLTQAELDESITENRLYHYINSQQINLVSELIFIDGHPYIVNVTSEKAITGKSLAQVREVIRKSLMLQRLRAAIKQHADELVSNANVEYRE